MSGDSGAAQLKLVSDTSGDPWTWGPGNIAVVYPQSALNEGKLIDFEPSLHQKIGQLVGQKENRVGVSFNLSSLRDIDAANSTFWAKGWLNILYVEPKILANPDDYYDGMYIDKEHDKGEDGKYTRASLPLPTLMSSYSVELAEQVMRVKDKSRGLVTWNIRYQGTFAMGLDVHNFPFDLHTLQIPFIFKPGYHLVHHEFDPTKCYGQLVNNSWDFLVVNGESKHNAPWLSATYSKFKSNASEQPKVTFNILVARKPFYYITNIVVVVVFLEILTGSVFLFGKEEGSVSTTLGALLALMAFKYSVAAELPKVGYLTVMDTYMLIGFVILSLTGVEAMVRVFVGWSSDETSTCRYDCLEGCKMAGIYAATILIQHIYLAAKYIQSMYFHRPREIRGMLITKIDDRSSMLSASSVDSRGDYQALKTLEDPERPS